MSRLRPASVAATVLLLAACAPKPFTPADADPSVLMEADRNFATDVAEGGSGAWVSWLAEDGSQIVAGAGEVTGHEAISELMAGLDDPSSTLTWEPIRADIAASGDLGWTTGRYVSEGKAADGTKRRGEGRYVTIWRKQVDGS